MRDKLIELIDNNKACDREIACCECEYSDISPCFAVRMADALIAHGITFADVPDNNVGDSPMTNGDKIRAMSDEELAEFLLKEKWSCGGQSCSYCGRYVNKKCVTVYEWLKQPAEADHDAD